ncbi:MAG: hypothetical protein H6525_00315 [Actinobacteria bacterium]|nr:hypothetical protein [Actinomycetota bacterium]
MRQEVFTSPAQLAASRGVRVIHSQDCNDPAIVQLLESLNIDVVLSVNVYQRMGEALLAAPSVCALNTHFGLLPHYKGMSPVIWAMSNNESRVGITIHEMVLAFDEGRIVAQEVVEIGERESVFSVTLRGCVLASRLLLDSLRALDDGTSAPQAQESGGSYFSLPTKGAIKKLYRVGRKLWRISDFQEAFAVLTREGGTPSDRQ